MPSYDDQNIFAKILREEIPSIRLYEDADTLCFMDIMPRADGHCLVIPKTPCRNVLDASPEQLASVMKTVQVMSHAVMKAFGAEGVTLQQFNEGCGRAGGLSPAFPHPAASCGCLVAPAGEDGGYGGSAGAGRKDPRSPVLRPCGARNWIEPCGAGRRAHRRISHFHDLSRLPRVVAGGMEHEWRTGRRRARRVYGGLCNLAAGHIDPERPVRRAARVSCGQRFVGPVCAVFSRDLPGPMKRP